MSFWVIEGAYLVASTLFVMSLYWMNDPKTARRAVGAGVAAIVLATLGTLFNPGIVNWAWIAGAVAFGILVGVPLSWVPLTAVPQRTAVSHAFGGLAAGLVGTAKFYLWQGEPESFTAFRTFALVAEVILGFLTFTGSLMAAGKLQEVRWIPQRPVTYPFQNHGNIGLLLLAVGRGLALVGKPVELPWLFPVIVVLALAATFQDPSPAPRLPPWRRAGMEWSRRAAARPGPPRTPRGRPGPDPRPSGET